MNSSQNGGKSKSSRSSSSKSKKGGNFLGSVSELFVPTGWESFATAAGLLAIDRADAAFRRNRKSSKKQKGGADIDAHDTFEVMDKAQAEILSDIDSSSSSMMNGGGPKKNRKSKPSAKKTTTKKTTDKKKVSKSKAKGGNFLGAVGDLVAPTGWGPFATAAGLLALERADAALRRGTKEKKEKMKGGKKSEKKMKGGDLTCEIPTEPEWISMNSNKGPKGYQYKVCCNYNNEKICRYVTYDKRPGLNGKIDKDKENERFNQAKQMVESYIKSKHEN